MAKRKRTRVVEATVEHRKTMDRVLDRKVTSGARSDFQAVTAVTTKHVSRQLRGGSRSPATKAHVRTAEKLLREHALSIGQNFSQHLVSSTKDTQVEAVRSLAAFLGKLKPEGSELDTDRVRERIINARRKGLEKERRSQATDTLRSIHADMRAQLKGLDLSDMSVSDLVAKTHEIAANQWWKIDRVIRTETSRAFNTAQADAFQEIAEEFPQVWMRWTELINDITGEPMDNRVANDSLVLHGQVAKPGAVFTMPPHPLAPSKMVGQTWAHPPNRPNDRAVLTPWVPGWNIPSWQWRSGRRFNLK